MTQMMPNYDYDLEAKQLQQRQQLMEAMMNGGLAPMQDLGAAAGGVQIKRSPLEAVMKVLQAYVGAKGLERTNADSANLTSRYHTDLKTGMSSLIDGLNAQPGQPTAVNDESGGHTGPMSTPQDVQAQKRDAILNAIASGHPVLQQLGMTQFQNMGKRNLEVKDLLAHATPESAAAMVQSGDVNRFVPKRELKPVKPSEALLNESGQITAPGVAPTPATPGAPGAPTPMQVPDGWKKIGEVNGIMLVQDQKGSIYQQSPTGWDEVDKAPKVSTTVNNHTVVNSGENAFAKGVGELNAKELGDLRKSGDNARKLLPVLSKFEQLTASPTFSGPTAKPSVWMGELANSLGLPVDKVKLANSEEYAGVVAKQISSYLTAGAGVGRSLTDADREAITQQFPTLVQSPQGRLQLSRMLREAAQRDINQSDAAEKEIAVRFPELKRLVPGGTQAPQYNSSAPATAPVIKNWPGRKN